MSPRDSFTNQATGVRRWSHLSIRAKLDMSTPLLFEKLAKNAKIPKAVLTCRKAGKEQFEYFKVTLTEVLVVKVEVGELEASGGERDPALRLRPRVREDRDRRVPTDEHGSDCRVAITLQDDLMSNK